MKIKIDIVIPVLNEESLLEIKGIASSTIEKVYSSVQQFIEREEPSIADEDSQIDSITELDEEE